MKGNPRFSLKSKVITALMLITLFSVMAGVFSSLQFYALEKRLRIINDSYVPVLNVLGQLESHLFLLEDEIRRSINDQKKSTASFQMQVMNSKIRNLSRRAQLNEEGNDPIFSSLFKLTKSYEDFKAQVELILLNDRIDDQAKSGLSQKRANFKYSLKELIRNIEGEIRYTSIEIQQKSKYSAVFLFVLILLALLCATSLLIWVDKTLSPLHRLTKTVKQIAENGLSSKDIDQLKNIAKHNDEFGHFSFEFSRMSSSLISRTEELELEREKLERAYAEMTKKNEVLRSTKSKLQHQEKLGLLGKLSAQMAHEIRNPLNALSLHLEVLEDEFLDSEPQIFSSMKNEIDRLSKITDSYLSFARVDREDFVSVNMNDLIRDVGNLYKSMLNAQRIEVDYFFDSVPDVLIDEKQIRLVLGNFYKNSSEAFGECDLGRKRKVHIFTKYDRLSSAVKIFFSDNGVGIKDNKSIFKPFYTTKKDGTGLGLAHSRQIIESHNGSIDLNNGLRVFEEGGASFEISLPAREFGNA